MTAAKEAIRLRQAAQRKRLLAPAYDPIRESCDIGEANTLEHQANSLLTPLKPLKTGSGGEIRPPMTWAWLG